jgi:hypothetical protein
MDRKPYLKAILTESGDVTLYQTNAYFKTMLDTYIGMIPMFVEGLREHAKIEQRKVDSTIRELRGTSTTTGSSYYGIDRLGWMDDR